MTSLRTAKALVTITQNLNPDAMQLAHVLLAHDEALPAQIKHGLTVTLLKQQKLEPMNRLCDLVIEILALNRPECRTLDGARTRHVACWTEIKEMGKRATVSNALLWFSMVCSIVLDDPATDATVH